jgi:ribosomal protein S18 acetylase RimI-like enzyme
LPAILFLYGQLGMDNGDVLPLDAAKRIIRQMCAYPDYCLYCALYEGAVIGVFALLIMDNLGHMGQPSAVMEDIVVDQAWRNRGIGSQLIAYALGQSRAKRCYKLSLSSNKNRKEAHRFYERLGFERHGISFALYLEDSKDVPL